MPEPTILDDGAVTEIEALSAKVPDGPWFTASDDADDVPGHRRSGLALVETGRSADWWIARLCEWHIAQFIADSKTNVDALCATVRALRAENAELRNGPSEVHSENVCWWTRREPGAGYAQSCGKETGFSSGARTCDGCGRRIVYERPLEQTK